jgi:hypothetical protein
MQQLSEHGARPRIRRALATAAALLCAVALSQQNLAHAGHERDGQRASRRDLGRKEGLIVKIPAVLIVVARSAG